MNGSGGGSLGRYASHLALIAATASQLHAQHADLLRAGVSSRVPSDSAAGSVAPHRSEENPPGLRTLDRLPLWSAPIASALIPGLGQARLHEDRFVVYVATEAYLLLQYVKNTRDGLNGQQAFRGIARDFARRNFVLAPGTTPPDTVWAYYEALRDFAESGFYTMTQNGPIVPETDTTTFNGHQWLLARKQFGVPLDDPAAALSPGYANALAFYDRRAAHQAYRWSWRNAILQRDQFVQTISQSNDSFRLATSDLVALIANHVVSSIDAFGSVRLIMAAGGGVRVSASIPVR